MSKLCRYVKILQVYFVKMAKVCKQLATKRKSVQKKQMLTTGKASEAILKD